MSDEKNTERDAELEAFLKTVMATASVPAAPAAKAAEATPAPAETEAEPVAGAAAEPVLTMEAAAIEPVPAPVSAAAATSRAAVSIPQGPRKFGPSAATQNVVKKPGPATTAFRSEAQKTQMAGMKSGTFPGKNATASAKAVAPTPTSAPEADPAPEAVAPAPAPLPVAAHGPKVLPKHESPIPLLNLVVSVVLLIMFMILLVMLVTLKGDLARQDNAIVKLRETLETVGTNAKIKFGVVQDPKRGLLGVFIDAKDPTRYKVVDLKEER